MCSCELSLSLDLVDLESRTWCVDKIGKKQMVVQTWLALVALALCHISAHSSAPPATANPSPTTGVPGALSPAASEFLEAHNQARADVGVEPLKWSQTLANNADRLVRYQRNQKGCQFANLTSGRYGGNQLWASGQTLTPRMVVEEWVKEKTYYNHASNTCEGEHMCGVYTQVVWGKSLELGCAQATCRKEGTSLTICFYNPPGNVVGESPY